MGGRVRGGEWGCGGWGNGGYMVRIDKCSRSCF